ncbi:solute:Na+ symporter, SSS family protein [Longimycelium tulufanense]|uniref:Solute:Na+ symporter, SSS family protein n=1 Tax=Longimycelium tulufanense TaxID=907463 RepID=A0A8J3FWX7_9PSEU|nr:sodium:solute symporter family protein [Longimycelium tulufanense]GGM63624.1 solute:Na+ symporter, SSS family protein [Longimycelium tulufanense]
MSVAADLRLSVSPIDSVIVVIFFAVVIGNGVLARRFVSGSTDFFLSGRSLPAWVSGFAFIAANLSAMELLGMAANGAQYGMPATHYYFIAAIPAMVFLGLVMMPFYYSSRVRSVPEFLRRRFNNAAHLFQSLAFAVASILIAGINLYALGLLVNGLLGWPVWLSMLTAALVVLSYTTFGGLSASINNEVMQFFVIVAALVPLTLIGLHRVGGWDALIGHVTAKLGEDATHAWRGTTVGEATNPFGNWIAIALGMGFVTSFGYWTTNFAEVQRALAAKDLAAARRAPLIGAFPKMLLPAVVILPGMIALPLLPELGTPGVPYNNALPLLIGELLPTGLVGLALAGLLASFMAGMAANISAFNTVVTYDIWQSYVRKDRADRYYLAVGRVATVVGIGLGIGAAFIAAGYHNIQTYIQQLQSFFNAPLFTTFLFGMLWKRVTPWAGFWGMIAGVAGAAGVYVAEALGWLSFNSEQAAAFAGSGAAFVADGVVTLAVTAVTVPKPDHELRGLVWSLTSRRWNTADRDSRTLRRWVQSPVTLGVICLSFATALSFWIA